MAAASSIGAIADLSMEAVPAPAVARAVLQTVVVAVGDPESSMRMSRYGSSHQEGRWKAFKWKAIDEAIADPDTQVVNLAIGVPQAVSFTLKLQLRWDPDPRRREASPRRWFFVASGDGRNVSGLADAGRAMLALLAEAGAAISGGVLAAPTFNQAYCEVEDGGNCQQEPAAYRERNKADQLASPDRVAKARRLYPITLLGPKLASQVTAAGALQAGALAAREIGGSLLLDAYPSVVETWDPAYLRATVELRRWLWPLTLQNPADAGGLGLKLPRLPRG